MELGLHNYTVATLRIGIAIAQMDEAEKNTIARSWIALHCVPEDSEEYQANFWAYDRVCDLCQSDPEVCWEIIEAVRRLDSSDLVLSNLAAGPVEDLLVAHGELIIEKIEKLAADDPQIRRLLGAVWQNEISEDVWSRIKKVADPSW